MPLLTVTLGSGATQFATEGRAMQMRCWQGANNSFIGDSSSMNNTTGIPVKNANNSVDPTIIGPFTSGAINLNQWYGSGSANDVIHVQYDPEE